MQKGVISEAAVPFGRPEEPASSQERSEEEESGGGEAEAQGKKRGNFAAGAEEGKGLFSGTEAAAATLPSPVGHRVGKRFAPN